MFVSLNGCSCYLSTLKRADDVYAPPFSPLCVQHCSLKAVRGVINASFVDTAFPPFFQVGVASCKVNFTRKKSKAGQLSDRDDHALQRRRPAFPPPPPSPQNALNSTKKCIQEIYNSTYVILVHVRIFSCIVATIVTVCKTFGDAHFKQPAFHPEGFHVCRLERGKRDISLPLAAVAAANRRAVHVKSARIHPKPGHE